MRQFIKKTLQFNNKGCLVIWFRPKKWGLKWKYKQIKELFMYRRCSCAVTKSVQTDRQEEPPVLCTGAWGSRWPAAWRSSGWRPAPLWWPCRQSSHTRPYGSGAQSYRSRPAGESQLAARVQEEEGGRERWASCVGECRARAHERRSPRSSLWESSHPESWKWRCRWSIVMRAAPEGQSTLE